MEESDIAKAEAAAALTELMEADCGASKGGRWTTEVCLQILNVHGGGPCIGFVVIDGCMGDPAININKRVRFAKHN
jgi:hypothetical protein